MLASAQLTKKINPEEIGSYLHLIEQEMILHQKNGNYSEAQNCRLKAISQTKRYQHETLRSMEERHFQERQSLTENYQSNIKQTNDTWSSTLAGYLQQNNIRIKNFHQNNKHQIRLLKEKIIQEWPEKIKESNQLINLRRMQETSNKQKNFIEAHRIQTRINDLYKSEFMNWLNLRDKTIQQAVDNLRTKQEKQKDLNGHKTQSEIEDLNKEWHNERISLTQRYNNQSKELKAAQQREALSFKKQFKTKGGQFHTVLGEESIE